tara:strand:- start:5 stop:640 length:636 start_codon:yes stop_codon:yes gene_type:complete
MTIDYSPGGIVCKMPEELLTLLQHQLHMFQTTEMPTLVGTNGAPGGSYKRWMIQTPPHISHTLQSGVELVPKEHANEKMFNVLHYKELHPVIEFFEQYVNSIFRFRMSTLQPTSFIEEHGNHMYPRIHIPLNETDFSFYINDKLNNDEVKPIKIEYGNAYFINVSNNHWGIIGEGSGERSTAFFSFDRFKIPEMTSKFMIPEYFSSLPQMP